MDPAGVEKANLEQAIAYFEDAIREAGLGVIELIEKIYKNKRMVVCDNCGTGQEFDTWTDALEYMFEEGWKKKLFDGEWKHYCPECVEVKEP